MKKRPISASFAGWLTAALAVPAMLACTAEARIVNVSTPAGLRSAVNTAIPGDDIVCAPGDYYLTHGLWVDVDSVTIRGATGSREDVNLIGGGMNTNSGVTVIMQLLADHLTVRDLTVSECFYNGIQVKGEYDIADVHIANVKTMNIGERHIKGSWSLGNPSNMVDGIVIENVYMLQTKPRLDTNPAGGDYIGGIDAMSWNNPVIRDCVAQGIYGAYGGGNAAIFLWRGMNNMTVERNVILDCAKGIGVGLCYEPGDTISGGWQADGGVIRNNFIVRTDDYFYGNNIGLELCAVKNLDAVNNTLYSPTASYSRMLSLWDNANIPNTNLQVVNNIVRGGCWYNGGNVDAMVAAWGNMVDRQGTVVVPAWFLDALNGDLHLTELAQAAIDAATPWVQVPFDIDGGPRGASPDMGADEFASPMADANYDGCVDGLDYVIWSNNYEPFVGGKTWPKGDYNGDQIVDGLDYVIWSNNYLQGCPGVPGAVPEPGALSLLALGLLGLRRRPRG